MNEMRIYVASLSDYNDGRLEGKWLDLSDYSDASELMEAIQEMLDELTEKYKSVDGEVREEFAVHDYEGIPATLASEYMGEQDFQQLYDIAEVADDRGIPVEVLIERAGDTGSDDYQALADSLIMSVNGNDESDIVYEYENQIGELGFDWWSNHVGITKTDQRLLYGEDVDNFKEEILAENPDLDEDEAEGQAEERADDEQEQRNSDLIGYLQERGYEDEFPNWVYKDYQDAWENDLSYEFDVIHHDGRMYVFTNNYSLGGTILSGVIGAYIGYKIGRAKPQKKGFQTEKKIGQKIKGTFSKKKMAKGGLLGASAQLEFIDEAYASSELQDELRKRLGLEENANSVGDNAVISFAYTDYGGDFLDKVAIAYFQENYPENTIVENAGYNGENAFVFGEPAQEWIDYTDDYPLGMKGLEDFYYEMLNESEEESFSYFLDDLERDYTFDREELMTWLIDNRSGYYSMTTQGLDISYSDMTNYLIREGLISKEDEDEDDEEYAEGGNVKRGLTYGKKDDVYFDVVTLLNSKMQKPKGIFGQERVKVQTMSLDSLLEYLKYYETREQFEIDLPTELFTKESFPQYATEDSKLRFISGKIYRLGKEELLKKKIDSYTKEIGNQPPQRVLAKFEREVQDAPQKTTLVQRIMSRQLLENGGEVEDGLKNVRGTAYYVSDSSVSDSSNSVDSVANTFFDSESDFYRLVRQGIVREYYFNVEVKNQWNINQAIYDEMESEGLLADEGNVQLVGYELSWSMNHDFESNLPYDKEEEEEEEDDNDDDYAKGGMVDYSVWTDFDKEALKSKNGSYFMSEKEALKMAKEYKKMFPTNEITIRKGEIITEYDFNSKIFKKYAGGGGVSYNKNWEVVGINKYGKMFKERITLGRMSDKEDVKNALRRRTDLNIREVTSIKEVFAKGGGIGFKGLSSKVAKRYEGKSVAPKYQSQYGTKYSKSEAKEVGDKVAGKVYWNQQGRKMAKGGDVDEINVGDKVIITTKSLGNQYEGMLGEITPTKLLNNKFSIKLENGLTMAFDKGEFRHNSINPKYSKGGGVDLFSMSKTINDEGQISEMVIAENVSVDEFNKLYSDKAYRKVNDKSFVGFYFAKANGDTIQLIPSFHKKGEILKYAKGGGVDYYRYDVLVHFLTNNGENMEKEYMIPMALSEEDAENRAIEKFHREDFDRYDAEQIQYISVHKREKSFAKGGGVGKKPRDIVEAMEEMNFEIVVMVNSNSYPRTIPYRLLVNADSIEEAKKLAREQTLNQIDNDEYIVEVLTNDEWRNKTFNNKMAKSGGVGGKKYYMLFNISEFGNRPMYNYIANSKQEVIDILLESYENITKHKMYKDHEYSIKDMDESKYKSYINDDYAYVTDNVKEYEWNTEGYKGVSWQKVNHKDSYAKGGGISGLDDLLRG